MASGEIPTAAPPPARPLSLWANFASPTRASAATTATIPKMSCSLALPAPELCPARTAPTGRPKTPTTLRIASRLWETGSLPVSRLKDRQLEESLMRYRGNKGTPYAATEYICGYGTKCLKVLHRTHEGGEKAKRTLLFGSKLAQKSL